MLPLLWFPRCASCSLMHRWFVCDAMMPIIRYFRHNYHTSMDIWAGCVLHLVRDPNSRQQARRGRTAPCRGHCWHTSSLHPRCCHLLLRAPRLSYRTNNASLSHCHLLSLLGHSLAVKSSSLILLDFIYWISQDCSQQECAAAAGMPLDL